MIFRIEITGLKDESMQAVKNYYSKYLIPRLYERYPNVCLRKEKSALVINGIEDADSQRIKEITQLLEKGIKKAPYIKYNRGTFSVRRVETK